MPKFLKILAIASYLSVRGLAVTPRTYAPIRWDYTVARYVEAARHLQALQGEGLIRQIGLTNFDVQRTQELLAAGISVVSNQVCCVIY